VVAEGRIEPAAQPGHQRYSLDAFFRYGPDVLVFPTSGLYEQPLRQRLMNMDRRYFASINAVLRDPRIDAYEGRAYRMPNGAFIEVMRRTTGPTADVGSSASRPSIPGRPRRRRRRRSAPRARGVRAKLRRSARVCTNAAVGARKVVDPASLVIYCEPRKSRIF
jgi:hypothetical protein